MEWPQEDTIDNPVVYFPGPIDFAAVEEFLRLINPSFLGERADHLGRLATRMLEKRQNASAADLVQLATKIDAESRLAVNKLPDIILEQMNAPTVGRLLEDLRDLDAARMRLDASFFNVSYSQTHTSGREGNFQALKVTEVYFPLSSSETCWIKVDLPRPHGPKRAKQKSPLPELRNVLAIARAYCLVLPPISWLALSRWNSEREPDVRVRSSLAA